MTEHSHPSCLSLNTESIKLCIDSSFLILSKQLVPNGTIINVIILSSREEVPKIFLVLIGTIINVIILSSGEEVPKIFLVPNGTIINVIILSS